MATTRRTIRAFTHDMGRTRTHTRARFRDQGEGDDFIAQVLERIDRIEQAIVRLAESYGGGDDEDESWEDSINVENRTSTTERTIDPGKVYGSDPSRAYGTADHWRGMDRRTNNVIRQINERHRRHYKQ